MDVVLQRMLISKAQKEMVYKHTSCGDIAKQMLRLGDAFIMSAKRWDGKHGWFINGKDEALSIVANLLIISRKVYNLRRFIGVIDMEMRIAIGLTRKCLMKIIYITE